MKLQSRAGAVRCLVGELERVGATAKCWKAAGVLVEPPNGNTAGRLGHQLHKYPADEGSGESMTKLVFWPKPWEGVYGCTELETGINS